MAPSAPDRLSRSIGIARVLCMFGVIYAHAWTGLAGDALATVAGSAQEVLRWTLMELLGRGAVPLLSMISGWLLANGRRQARPYRAFLTGKARAILLPMVCWNALSILLVSGAAAFGLLKAPMPQSTWWVLDELLCLVTPNDINVQTAFLRDLFICLALAPLLLRASPRVLVLVMLGSTIWSIGGWVLPLLLRPSILLFFVSGILARRQGWAEPAARLPLLPLIAPLLVLIPLKVVIAEDPVWLVGVDPRIISMIDLPLRAVVALLFWRLAWQTAGSRIGERIGALEKYAFFVFCAHLIVIWLGGPFLGRWTGPLGSPLYPAYLIAQPVLVGATCIAAARLLSAASMSVAGVLSGGRLARRAAEATKLERMGSAA